MRNWTRRRLLASLSSLSVFALAGSPKLLAAQGPTPNDPASLPPLIDCHCHLFNITDLPAATFSQIVLLKSYPRRGGPTPAQRILAGTLRGMEKLLSKNVPTAAQEAKGGALGKQVRGRSSALSQDDERELQQQEQVAEAARRDGAAAADGQERCERSGGPAWSVASVRGWLQSLRSRRAAMVRELAAAQQASGFAPRLLCPALVDYSNWLGQELQSPLPDQVRMGGILAGDPSLPPVHGYVAFDPLRSALVRTRRATVDGSWDPLALAREALVEHGYLGVKLYPPMGFRPAGNARAGQSYPPRVEALFDSADSLAAELDRSLDDLWALCLELDAPVMAHAANSNAGGSDYGRRADPAYWLPVVSAHPGLRVMLGHFGRFGTYSAGHRPAPGCRRDAVPFEATWEAAIGRFVADHPDSGLFADISYLSDVFDPAERARAAAGMRRYLELDQGGRHLVYGSDWVMLGVERDYPKPPGYAHRVADFLGECGLADEQVAGIMYGNAIRFLGLSTDAGARRRLLAFYARHGLPPERLPA